MARFHNWSKPTVIVYLEAQHLVKKWVELKNLGNFLSDCAFAQHLLEQEERRYQISCEYLDQNTLVSNEQMNFATTNDKQQLLDGSTCSEFKTEDSDSIPSEEIELVSFDLQVDTCLGNGEKAMSVSSKNATSENQNSEHVNILIFRNSRCEKSFEGTLPQTITVEPPKLKKVVYASQLSNQNNATKPYKSYSKASSTEGFSISVKEFGANDVTSLDTFDSHHLDSESPEVLMTEPTDVDVTGRIARFGCKDFQEFYTTESELIKRGVIPTVAEHSYANTGERLGASASLQTPDQTRGCIRRRIGFCHICPKAFTRRETLNHHMRAHRKEYSYGCDMCAQCFMSEKSLYQHAILAHCGESGSDRRETKLSNIPCVYQCSQCPLMLPTEKLLKTHRCRSIKEQKCRICSKLFESKKAFLEHCAADKGCARAFICEFCNKSWATDRALERHLVLHRKTYYCEDCDRAFRHQRGLDKHLATHEGIEITVEPSKHDTVVNEYASDNENDVTKSCQSNSAKGFSVSVEESGANDVRNVDTFDSHHQDSENQVHESFLNDANTTEPTDVDSTEPFARFSCKDCPKFYPTEAELINHRRAVHHRKMSWCYICPKMFRERCLLDCHMRDHRKVYSHNCDKCAQCFMDEDSLSQHSALAHARESDSESGRTTIAPNIHCVYQCSECPLMLPTEDVLKKHRCHSIKEQKCRICSKIFESKKAFLEHCAAHEGCAQTYKCQFCDKSYKSTQRLELHMVLHAKSHYCEICDRSFRHQRGLDKHLATHAPVNPVWCESCGKSFSSGRKLQMHMNGVHRKIVRFICHTCGQSFHHRIPFEMHINKHMGLKPLNEDKLQKIICEVCGMSFRSELARKKHHNLNHNADINICKFCWFRTTEIHLLVDHIKKRHPEIVARLGGTVDFEDVSTMTKTKVEAEELLRKLKPFQCKVCFKRMSLAHEKKHMKLHREVQREFDHGRGLESVQRAKSVVDSKVVSTVTGSSKSLQM